MKTRFRMLYNFTISFLRFFSEIGFMVLLHCEWKQSGKTEFLNTIVMETVNQHTAHLMLYRIYAGQNKKKNAKTSFFLLFGYPSALGSFANVKHWNRERKGEKRRKKSQETIAKIFWKVSHIEFNLRCFLMAEKEYFVSQCDNCVKSTFCPGAIHRMAKNTFQYKWFRWIVISSFAEKWNLRD